MVDIYLTLTHLLEERPELGLVHETTITDLKECPISPVNIQIYKSTNETYRLFDAFSLLFVTPQFWQNRTYSMKLITEIGSSNVGGGISERRGTGRFPLREEVKYKVLHTKSMDTIGSGQTLNIGSGGILFTTEERLPVGRMVELNVNWPARLDGTCPLKFVAVGRVVRADATRAAVRIERYEFRTRRTAAPILGEAPGK